MTVLVDPFEVEQDGTYLLSLEDTNYQFVVRREELDRFIAALEQAPIEPIEEKRLHPPEKRSLLKFIGILLYKQNIDPSVKGSSSAIMYMSEEAGISLCANTVRKVLDETADVVERW